MVRHVYTAEATYENVEVVARIATVGYDGSRPLYYSANLLDEEGRRHKEIKSRKVFGRIRPNEGAPIWVVEIGDEERYYAGVREALSAEAKILAKHIYERRQEKQEIMAEIQAAIQTETPKKPTFAKDTVIVLMNGFNLVSAIKEADNKWAATAYGNWTLRDEDVQFLLDNGKAKVVYSDGAW